MRFRSTYSTGSSQILLVQPRGLLEPVEREILDAVLGEETLELAEGRIAATQVRLGVVSGAAVEAAPHGFCGGADDAGRYARVLLFGLHHGQLAQEPAVFEVHAGEREIASRPDVEVGFEFVGPSRVDFGSLRIDVVLGLQQRVHNVSQEDALAGAVLPDQDGWFGDVAVEGELDVELFDRTEVGQLYPFRVHGCVPHPVSWTHVYATRLDAARVPGALRAACDTPASRGASTDCSVRRTRRRRRAHRPGFGRPGRRLLAP